MSDSNDPNAWLGLLKWSLSHHDGTEPSDARTMSDEDRAWLQKVVEEGVRDDVRVMTEIYGRLCEYLDRAAISRTHSSTASPPVASSESSATNAAVSRLEADAKERSSSSMTSSVAISAAPSENLDTAHRDASAPVGALSLFVSPRTLSVGSSADATPGESAATASNLEAEVDESNAEEVENLFNDLVELQDIVEQIDLAATFVKIGGFGRLIALAAPSHRPEKLRYRALSVMATLTKNNPPAQASFSSSGGPRALLQAAQESSRSSSDESRDERVSSPVFMRAVLHALSCASMGDPVLEDALCEEEGFRSCLALALSQGGQTGGDGDANINVPGGGDRAKLRSKAAFIFKALVGAPGASASRLNDLWPAMLGLLTGLEALAETGAGDDPATARETCLEALLAATRSAGGERVVYELRSRISVIMAKRHAILEEAMSRGQSEEDRANSSVELSLWSQWDSLSGPAQ